MDLKLLNNETFLAFEAVNYLQDNEDKFRRR